MKTIFRTCLMVIIALTSAVSLWARKVDIYDLSPEENIATPEVTNEKQAERIADYQYQKALDLLSLNKDYTVELMRDNEVVIVTIDAEKLFGQNDTVLTTQGKDLLGPMLAQLKNPGFYKMILEMHSDDTGSQDYLYALTRGRVNAVFDWLDEKGSVDWVVPYAMDEKEPIVPNNSMDNRRTNRRLEIYLVPGDVMLEQAKKGKIDINNIKSKR